MGTWENYLLRIGDKCPEYGPTVDFKDHIEICFTLLCREIKYFKEEILPFFLQCVEQLPHKIPLYGTLVGLLNIEDEDFVRKIVQTTQIVLQDALNCGNCNRIRILMRFVISMMSSKVLQPGSLVAVFETLLSSAATTVDVDKGSPWQAHADFYVTCILSCLPWGGADLVEQVPEEFDRVMVGVEAYLSIRRPSLDVGCNVFEEAEESATIEKDFVVDLWHRIQALSKNGWKVDSVPRPHLIFEALLVGGKSFDFGPISCPEIPDPFSTSGIIDGKQKHDAEMKYPQRLRRLNIFSADKFEGLQPIDRHVVEEYLLDILLFFNGCRKECASYLVGLPVPFRYEYLMAETIFSQLLLLPRPPFNPMYYALVIIDLCKALPGAFPAVVASAVRTLFERIAELDMESRMRFILWFSHHLSNFQFIWPWEEWAYVLNLPKWAPQRVFVHEVFERETRLSYWEKIKQSIGNAPTLEELLPAKVGSNFKYSREDGRESTEEHVLSAELCNMVKGRKTARDVIAWIEERLFPVHGLEVTLRVVIQTFLDIGSKSFTHLITVLERYGQVIAKICPDQDKQVLLIVEVSSYWKNSAQMTAICLDRMMGYRLITNLAIVRWVFAPENIEQFHTSDRQWEILGNAVSKTYNRICDLRKEIASLQKEIASVKQASEKAKAELEAAESKLTLVDGEPVLGENPVRLKRLKSYSERAKEHEVSTHDSLEAKEALLVRAFEENEALFLSLYRNFSNVLSERLSDVARDGKMLCRQAALVDSMAVDEEGSSVMDLDSRAGEKNTSESNGGGARTNYSLGEKEQWCLSTLGYVKAFSRQYASEIWPHMKKLDLEVMTEEIHPLFRKAVFCGLHRQI